MPATLSTAAANVVLTPITDTNCIICGEPSDHDCCSSCVCTLPDGSVDDEMVDEMIAADLRAMRRAA